MLSSIIASFELSASWVQALVPAPVKDKNGTTISIGSKVKLIGTVRSVDTYTNRATIQFDYSTVGQTVDGSSLVVGT